MITRQGRFEYKIAHSELRARDFFMHVRHSKVTCQALKSARFALKNKAQNPSHSVTWTSHSVTWTVNPGKPDECGVQNKQIRHTVFGTLLPAPPISLSFQPFPERLENSTAIQKIIFVSNGVKILNRPPRKNKNEISTTVELGAAWSIYPSHLPCSGGRFWSGRCQVGGGHGTMGLLTGANIASVIPKPFYNSVQVV